jgi:DNA-binding NarL/FixJ family response regulator
LPVIDAVIAAKGRAPDGTSAAVTWAVTTPRDRPCCEFAALERVLEAVYQPVWLVEGSGRILHCNAAARAAAYELSADDLDDPRFAVSRVAIAGQTIDAAVLSLVVARNVPPHPPLPPSLARVASLVARGLTDKDIAAELDTPLSTVRTYVRRIYTRLGVRSRVELARRWSRR